MKDQDDFFRKQEEWLADHSLMDLVAALLVLGLVPSLAVLCWIVGTLP